MLSYHLLPIDLQADGITHELYNYMLPVPFFQVQWFGSHSKGFFIPVSL